MNVLIIGGSNFVGRALVDHFLQEHKHVTVLNQGTRPVYGTEQLTANRNSAHQMNLALEGRSFDCVVDTSCYTGEQASIALQALGNRIGYLIEISSSAVYVEDDAIPMNEEHPTGKSPQWGSYSLSRGRQSRCSYNTHSINRLQSQSSGRHIFMAPVTT